MNVEAPSYRRVLAGGFIAAVLASLTLVSAQTAVTLTVTPSPSAAQPGIQVVNITGSGFPSGTIAASGVTITLTPAAGGASTTATPTAVATVAGTTRRVTFVIPATISVSNPTAYRVRLAGATTAGTKFASTNQANLTINPAPRIVSVSPPHLLAGTSTAVTITTRSTNFVQGATVASFGPGTSVGGGSSGAFGPVTVTSPTSAVAQVSSLASAGGPVSVTVKTGVQEAALAGGFTIDPLNRPPTVNAGGPYTVDQNIALAFASALFSDPDGDTLTISWDFGDGSKGTGAAPSHTYVTAGTYTARVTAADGRGGSTSATATVTVAAVNRPPTASAGGPYAVDQNSALAFASAAFSDPDGDTLTITWDFGDGTAGAGSTPSHTYALAGTYTARVTAADGRGGIASATATVNVAALLQSITVTPGATRLAALTNLPLTVTGTMSDASTQNLTAPSTGTTYESSNPFVATVTSSGVVIPIANGTTIITARNRALAASTAITVEVGVTLQSLRVTPATSTLRAVDATQSLVVTGTFSDGTTRDLSLATSGTTYLSTDATVVSVTADGLASAKQAGAVVVTVLNELLSAQAQFSVSISTGTGFVRGVVFNDAKGLPLAGATATLVADGGGPMASPVTVTTDESGEFALPGRSGDVLVAVQKPGFTTVFRAGSIVTNTSARLLDARVTPLDVAVTPVASAFSETARDSARLLAAVFVPGSLPTDTDVRLTAISAQGLQGRLPMGWAPLAAVDFDADEATFQVPVVLRSTLTQAIAASRIVTVARYDRAAQRWIAGGVAAVSGDGRELSAATITDGQYAFIVPDVPAAAWATPLPGDALGGAPAVDLPATLTASGQVAPRSAPPGEGAHGVGTITVQAPIPSGTPVRARVRERFDLFDATTAVPRPFAQDILLFAPPFSTGADRALTAAFPVTPSRDYSIQELQLGRVHIDVTAPESPVGGVVVGPGGGSHTDADGNVLQIIAGAVGRETLVSSTSVPIDELRVSVPDGFTFVAALHVNLGGSLAQSAVLTLQRPPGIADNAQVLVTQVITDATGRQYLRVVSLADVQPDRLVTRATAAGLTFRDIREGGEYIVLAAAAPVGFVSGILRDADGTTGRDGALVASDILPFGDITSGGGAFIVPGRVASATTIVANDPVTHTQSQATVVIADTGTPHSLNLTLGVVALSVVGVIPAQGANNVALSSSVSIVFSGALDAGSVTADTVALRLGGGAVAGIRSLSADRRVVTFVPQLELSSKAVYTLAVSSAVRSENGTPLSAAVSATFTTIDTSKPLQPAAGAISALLPDDDGLVLVSGSLGTAEPQTSVTATNLRTQETITVLASTDGSFRSRVPASLGDQLGITLRNGSGQDVTVAITQFENPDGSVGLGAFGGTIRGADRVARVLPRAIATPGIFKLSPADPALALAALPGGFAVVDRFGLTVSGAAFNTLRSVTLSESQNRLPADPATAPPFVTSGSLAIPIDALFNGKLNVSAVAVDNAGNRNTVNGSLLIVSASPDSAPVVTGVDTEFPSVFIEMAPEGTPNQQVPVSAVAPAARVDFELNAPAGVDESARFLLVRAIDVDGAPKLSVLDALSVVDDEGRAVLKTDGRVLPGSSASGQYAVVRVPADLTFVDGRITGAPALVTAADSPFVFEASGTNASFTIPVRANQPFELSFLDAVTGESRGTATGQAAATGRLDVGEPLGAPGQALTVAVFPDANALVDISMPVLFSFSEPVDSKTFGGIVVTTPNGSRVLGAFEVSTDGLRAKFTPSRRWRFGTRYRYAVPTTVLARSGARLARPFNGEFTTFAPKVLATVQVDDARDVAVAGNLATVAGADGLTVLDVSDPLHPTVKSQIPLEGGANGVALAANPQIVDRNGQPVSGPVALAVSGTAADVGKLTIVGLTSPDAPAVLGSAELTVPPGRSPPAGVPIRPAFLHP